MQARGADGHSGEQKVSDGFGCLLQCGHHLEMGIVNMAEEGILILYTGQKTVQKLLNVDLRTSRITSFKVYPRACALRGLGLLLADGTPTGGRGEDFLSRQQDFFTETAVTSERKVEKSFPRWEINRHVEG